MIIALRAPADGPIGDSGLVVDDGETVCFNMNDARPVDLDVVHADFGAVDVHMLQYSGAIWYPMVYDMPARAKEAFGTQKRQRQMDRCRQYIAQVGATWVIPSAGPPCFLDPALRDLNDDHGDPANIFPDQVVFLDQMRTHGHDGGLLMIPGSTADFTGSQLNSLRHPLPDDEVKAIFTTGKAAYIADYAERMAPVLAAEKANWAPAAGESLLEPLRTLFEPIMIQSDQICDGIGYPVELRLGPETSRAGLSETRCARTYSGREVPIWLRDRAGAGEDGAAGRRAGLGQHDLPVDPVLGMAGRRLQRVPLHVLQVPDRRAHRVRRRLVRRGARRHRVDHVGRLGDSATLPAPEGRPVEVRRGGRLDADLQPARLAVESRERPMPDDQGARAALRREVRNRDRTAPVLRRRADPARPRGDHVAALPLSVGHIEGHSAARRPRLQGRTAGDVHPSGSASGAARICGAGCRWTSGGRSSPRWSRSMWPVRDQPAFTPQRPKEFLAKLDELLDG